MRIAVHNTAATLRLCGTAALRLFFHLYCGDTAATLRNTAPCPDKDNNEVSLFVAELKRMGADTTIGSDDDDDGLQTALMFAVANRARESVQVLLQAPRDQSIDQVGADNFTAKDPPLQAGAARHPSTDDERRMLLRQQRERVTTDDSSGRRCRPPASHHVKHGRAARRLQMRCCRWGTRGAPWAAGAQAARRHTRPRSPQLQRPRLEAP
jgi:hypothetical protein